MNFSSHQKDMLRIGIWRKSSSSFYRHTVALMDCSLLENKVDNKFPSVQFAPAEKWPVSCRTNLHFSPWEANWRIKRHKGLTKSKLNLGNANFTRILAANSRRSDWSMQKIRRQQKTMGLCAKNFNENQAKILVVLKNEQGFFKCML